MDHMTTPHAWVHYLGPPEPSTSQILGTFSRFSENCLGRESERAPREDPLGSPPSLSARKVSENLEKVPRILEGEGSRRSEIMNPINNDYWLRLETVSYFEASNSWQLSRLEVPKKVTKKLGIRDQVSPGQSPVVIITWVRYQSGTLLNSTRGEKGDSGSK